MRSWRLLAVSVAVALLCIGAASEDQSYRVRLFSSAPPNEIHLTAQPRATWRECAKCGRHEFSQTLTIASVRGRVRISGVAHDFLDLLISGPYWIDANCGERKRAFAANFPLSIRVQAGALVIIARMPAEDYVAGVVAGEAGAAGDESLKAQAVAARTFALRMRGAHKFERFDFCDSTHCQRMDWQRVTDHIRSAVSESAHEVLWYDGAPAAAFYHQDCGGTTAAGRDVWPAIDAPYLMERQDPYCAGTRIVWQSTLSVYQISGALVRAGIAVPDWSNLRVGPRTSSQRAKLIEFLSPAGSIIARVPASVFRFATDRELGWNVLRSDLYEVSREGERFMFTGRGSGHGAGMCQRGAAEMAREGRTYREILAFYYPGTSVGVAASDIHWHVMHARRFDVLSTHLQSEGEDGRVAHAAENAMLQAEDVTGLTFISRPRIQLYPTIEMYRDATGEPGWVAASTRGHTIRLQPVHLLEARDILSTTLRHEFLHQLIESRARAGLPLWFREGLVLYLNNDCTGSGHGDSLDEDVAVRERSAELLKVQRLATKYGKQRLLYWLQSGLPN